VLLDEIRDTALARLRVDTNDGLIALAQVGRVDGEVRDVPVLGGAFLRSRGMSNPLSLKAFLDGVLVGPREGGVDEVASPRVSWVNGEIGALSNSVDDRLDVAEVEVRADTLGIEVESQSDNVDVASTLAIAEQAAFNAVASGQHTELSSSNTAAYMR
jgi:hypothetical protein